MTRNEILNQHYKEESDRADDQKLWSGLWYSAIPVEFLVVATQEKFNGSVWAVYAYIAVRMNRDTGASHKIQNSDICKALSISEWTLDRAKSTLKEYQFLSEDDGDGSTYYLRDIETTIARSITRRNRKEKEARLAKHEAAIAEEEERLGVELFMRQKVDLIREKFDGEEYYPTIQ